MGPDFSEDSIVKKKGKNMAIHGASIPVSWRESVQRFEGRKPGNYRYLTHALKAFKGAHEFDTRSLS